MTLRVVADNTVALDVYNFKDIAACVRRFADQLEAGDHGEPARLVVVAQFSDGVTNFLWGEGADPYTIMGVLDAGKMSVFADLVVGDDD
jgi:hypothetical protein